MISKDNINKYLLFNKNLCKSLIICYESVSQGAILFDLFSFNKQILVSNNFWVKLVEEHSDVLD